MQTQHITNSKQRLITFSDGLYDLGKMKAQRLGLTFTEYVRFLLVDDIKRDVEAKSFPLVDMQTEDRIGESMKAAKKGEYATLISAKDVEKHFKNL